MKKLILLLFIPFMSFGQEIVKSKFNADLGIIKAKASCGICMFSMQGKQCELAIQLDNNNKYYVNGAEIDDYGDAHSDEGFCNAILDVTIQGEINNDKFNLSFFQLSTEKSDEIIKP